MKQFKRNKTFKGAKKNFASDRRQLGMNSPKSDVMIEETLEQRLNKIIEGNKAISELIIGYIPYSIHFINQKFSGTTNKPAKISAFEKAIVGIINIDGQSSFSTIGKIMGLDIEHDTAEKKMLRDAIDSMIRYKLINGDESAYFITEQGKEFAAHGERMSTFNADFELWFINEKPDFVSLRECVSSLDDAILIDKGEIFPDGSNEHTLSFNEIINLAEAQASNMQSAKERFILQSATLKATSYYKYDFSVCFVQSIRTKEVRSIVFDDKAQKVFPSLSRLIDSDENIKQTLFNNMLKSASENKELSIFDNIDAAHAQIDKEDIENVYAAEQKLIAQEEYDKEQADKEDNRSVEEVDLSERLHKRALYDSITFEAEIHNIFQNDKPDEVWLSSPWVGDVTFIRNRLPLIKNYLNRGGKVFISYSAPDEGLDSHKDKMVGEKSQITLSELEKNYPKQFYHVELPAFHKKNVIEVKNGQCVLFTGSFNVLSFSVTSKNVTHIRAEEMCLAHYQAAINQYNETKRNFANIYILKAKKDIEEYDAEKIVTYNNVKLQYFKSDENLADLFIDFDNLFEERKAQIENDRLLQTFNQYKKNIEFSLTHGLNFKDVNNYRIELYKLSQQLENKEFGKSILSEIFQLQKKLDGVRIHSKEALLDKKTPSTYNDNSDYIQKAMEHYNNMPKTNDDLFKYIISLFYLTLSGNAGKAGINNGWMSKLTNILLDKSWKGNIIYGLTKEKKEGLIRIFVVINEYLFAFSDILLEKNMFFQLSKGKSFITLAKYKDGKISINKLIKEL
jgi:hypothetical protein